MTVVSGVSVWITNSLSISQLPPAFVEIFASRPLGNISTTVIVVAALAALMSLLMSSSTIGRWIYAVGINDRAALIARVPIQRVVLLSYLFAGAMAGITAIFLTARLGSASASMGNDGMVLDIVSACVVGGISIYGGAGRVAGALLGALLITVLSNAMNLVGVSFYASLLIKGIVIVAYVAADPARVAK